METRKQDYYTLVFNFFLKTVSINPYKEGLIWFFALLLTLNQDKR